MRVALLVPSELAADEMGQNQLIQEVLPVRVGDELQVAVVPAVDAVVRAGQVNRQPAARHVGVMEVVQHRKR